ncbi:MAG TPA: maltotransferase domain-containing protein [Stellaceae bacterium]|nr:maltotransferase domain-containing protein [Stellaceae bacterium]
MRQPPRIYTIHPESAGPIAQWAKRLPRIVALGFDTIHLPPFQPVGSSEHPASIVDFTSIDRRWRGAGHEPGDLTPLHAFIEAAAAKGLAVITDLIVTHTAREAPLMARRPEWYGRDMGGNPRKPFPSAPEDAAEIDWNPAHDAEQRHADLTEFFAGIARQYVDLGIKGFRCPAAWKVPGRAWAELIDRVRDHAPLTLFLAEALERWAGDLGGLSQAGFDGIFGSVRWWDGEAQWFLDQHQALGRIAPVLGFADTPDAPNLTDELEPGLTQEAVADRFRWRYLLACCFSDGIAMPMGFEDVAGDAAVTSANMLKSAMPALSGHATLTRLSGPGFVQIYQRQSVAEDSAFILVNLDRRNGYTIDVEWLLSNLPQDLPFDIADVTPGMDGAGFLGHQCHVGAGEIRVIHAAPIMEVLEPDAVPSENPPSRCVVERPLPMLDGGKWPVKRVVGETLQVTADIFRDGHDKVAAALRLREAGASQWRVTPMRFVDNDRWGGAISLRTMGEAQYTIEAWTDHFASWRDETIKKRNAGQNIDVDLIEGRALVEAALARAQGPRKARLQALLDQAAPAEDSAARTALLTSRAAGYAMATVPDKSDRFLFAPTLSLTIDRERGQCGAWYEMFPRSQGTEPNRSATFEDCTRRLPEIRDLGFDVVYLVPIHPIGAKNRKGRHNSLSAGPGDPGSPYATGSQEGGHTAINPELGTLADFRKFQLAVREHGMELALDFAVQCSPDHPWLKEHPGWFRRRADGSIKYAENPPKKYEDIVNVDFDHPDWQAAWQGLRDVVLFWVGEGVKIFRVDNPHTKPVEFWRWMIADIREKHPDVLFLAEAFTRPKMMRYLAKLGFNQSYTYFTWRVSKQELTEYLTELTTTDAREFFRPNFFVNTPDILPLHLQTGGRPIFRARLALAATLVPTYGLYNGFELCEAEGIPGKEEYYDSEKYTYKVWDWNRPGHIKDDIAKLNRLRRSSRALQSLDNLRFLEASHPSVLFYEKTAPAEAGLAAERIIVAVNLDPHMTAETELVFPLDGHFATEDILSGEVRHWVGARHTVSIDPHDLPARIWRLLPQP